MQNYLLFSTGNESLRVASDAVVYITADGNYSDIVVANGNSYTLTMQLGQVELCISQNIDIYHNNFLRIGRSLIINYNYVTHINVSRQKLIMSDCRTFRYELNASRDSLKALKDLIDRRSHNE